jgi:hypothetical protein
MSQQQFYVYIYYDPRNNQPFYVGKGCGRRCYDHLKETEYNTDNIFKWRKINSIRNDGSEPIIKKEIENLTEEQAYNNKASLIRQYGRTGIDPLGILTNRCEDLRPPSAKGKKFSEEHKAKLKAAYWKRVSEPEYVHPCAGKNPNISPEGLERIRAANRRPKTEEEKRKVSESKKQAYQNGQIHPMLGRHHTEETKGKISRSNTGKVRSQEHIEKIRQSVLGTHCSEERKQAIAKANASEWRIIDSQGNSFMIDNLNSWCKQNGFASQNFIAVSKGRLPHAYGYKCEKIS